MFDYTLWIKSSLISVISLELKIMFIVGKLIECEDKKRAAQQIISFLSLFLMPFRSMVYETIQTDQIGMELQKNFEQL